MTEAAGYTAALLSAVVAGSWQALTKHEAIARHRLHPAAVLLPFMTAFFICSWLVLLVTTSEFVFTPWGLLSGAVFCLGITLQVAVIFPAVGIAVGSGIQSSVAVITSLFWTADVLHEPMRSGVGTVCGVVVVVLGMNVIIFTGRVFGSLGLEFDRDDGEGAPSETTPLVQVELPPASPLPPPETERPPPGAAAHTDDDVDDGTGSTFARGAGVAMLAGVCQGSFLVPAEETSSAASGLAFLPSMGLGVALAALPCVALALYLAPDTAPSPHAAAGSSSSSPDSPGDAPKKKEAVGASSLAGAAARALLLPLAVVKETAPWTLLGGALNVLAIACIITAMDDVDYVVANTLNQLSVFVTGLWGWAYLGELQGRTAATSFFAGAAVLLVGAVLVAYCGSDSR